MDVTSSSLTAAGGGFRSPCLHVAVGDVGAVFELGEVFHPGSQQGFARTHPGWCATGAPRGAVQPARPAAEK